MGRKTLALASVLLGALLAYAQARPPSQPAPPGQSQAVSLPGSTQQSPTPDSRQQQPTPNATQASLPNAFFGGVEPSQPAAVSTFTTAGTTTTIVEHSTAGVFVSSIPPGPRVFLPAELQGP